MYMYMYVCAIERGYVLHNNTCNKCMYFKCTFNVYAYIHVLCMHVRMYIVHVCMNLGGYYNIIKLKYFGLYNIHT